MEASLEGDIVDSGACGVSERYLIKPQSMVSDLDMVVWKIVFSGETYKHTSQDIGFSKSSPDTTVP